MLVSKQLLQRRRLLFSIVVFLTGIAAIFIIACLQFYKEPIRSDGLGYYFYLPAFFIHNDIGLQTLAAERFGGYIPPVAGATTYAATGQYLIKYPMGVALLMTPFFLIACLIALVTGAAIDGFSFPFQYAAAVSGLFYAAAGLSILWSVLQKHFKQNTIILVLSGLLFSTNLFHYATYDSLFSHAYSFFLFSAFLYFVERVYSQYSARNLMATGAVAGLILVTRPTNGLWLIMGLLYGVTSFQALRDRCSAWKHQIKDGLLALLPMLGIISLQVLYWKTITGKLVVYSYPDEGFNFLKPEILNVLFSVRKGLFFWSPLLLTIIPGMFYIRKRAPEYFVPALVFLALNTYVISSWWYWSYGASFGSRAFLESLPIFAIALCALYEGIKTVNGKRAMRATIFCCALLSTWLMAKYWTHVIPYDNTTWSHFVDTFWTLSE